MITRRNIRSIINPLGDSEKLNSIRVSKNPAASADCNKLAKNWLAEKSAKPAQSNDAVTLRRRRFANQNKTQTESNLMTKIVDARLHEAKPRG